MDGRLIRRGWQPSGGSRCSWDAVRLVLIAGAARVGDFCSAVISGGGGVSFDDGAIRSSRCRYKLLGVFSMLASGIDSSLCSCPLFTKSDAFFVRKT